jgi:hypothetical protein
MPPSIAVKLSSYDKEPPIVYLFISFQAAG